MRLIIVPVANRPECRLALDAAFEFATSLRTDMAGYHIRPESREQGVARGPSLPDDDVHTAFASIRREHEAIHSALVAATRVPGRVGTAAKALADVLHPHFVREEEIALPPLGLLAPLAAGEALPKATLSTAAMMTAALRAEMPKMLEEHVRIHAAVADLRAAAEAVGAEAQVELADELALHARTEEEVLYPAALLVDDLLRAREQPR